jgi:hypothetical protein
MGQMEEMDLSKLSHKERMVQRKLAKQRAADARAQELIAQGRRQYFENQKSAEKNRYKLYQGNMTPLHESQHDKSFIPYLSFRLSGEGWQSSSRGRCLCLFVRTGFLTSAFDRPSS